jgi:hypothetical protein
MKKTLLLALAITGTTQLVAQQPTTMITSTTFCDNLRTEVEQVEKITFTDTI